MSCNKTDVNFCVGNSDMFLVSGNSLLVTSGILDNIVAWSRHFNCFHISSYCFVKHVFMVYF